MTDELLTELAHRRSNRRAVEAGGEPAHGVHGKDDALHLIAVALIRGYVGNDGGDGSTRRRC